MPIYEYACQQCEHRLEKLQKLSDPLLSQCPQCGQDSLMRLMSAAGFQLKGTGWYETDFKHKGKQPQQTSQSNETQSTEQTTQSDKGQSNQTSPSESSADT